MVLNMYATVYDKSEWIDATLKHVFTVLFEWFNIMQRLSYGVYASEIYLKLMEYRSLSDITNGVWEKRG